MAIIKKQADINVLQAARQRVINVFSNNIKVYMSFSGGKDSIVLADITYNLIKEGLIDPSLLTVQFIDEEGMYDDVIEIVKAWRKRFLLVGAKFEWYCVEVKHFSCFNMLTEDETFICWDRYEEENWIRTPPPFAIRSHPLLDARMENYQTFLPRTTRDGIIMIGTRAAESVQRLINMSDRNMNQLGDRKFVPIYDWKDHDVWLYLYQNNVDIPISYVQMWQVGVPKNQLRISQFFSIDTAKCLVKMAEFKPDLMNRVTKREPNAYLASLYYDSEMFRRSSPNRRKIEKEKDNKDYKRMVIQLLSDINGNFDTELQRKVAHKYKYSMMKAIQYNSSQSVFKKMYEGLVAGDPKLRTHRAVNNMIFHEYHDAVRKGKK